jgi:hypothetical protein
MSPDAKREASVSDAMRKCERVLAMTPLGADFLEAVFDLVWQDGRVSGNEEAREAVRTALKLGGAPP